MFKYRNKFNEIKKDEIFRANKRPKDSMNMSKNQLTDSTKKFFELYATKEFDCKNEKWKIQDDVYSNNVKFNMLGTTDFTEEERKIALINSLFIGIDYAYNLSKNYPEKYIPDKIPSAVKVYRDIWTKIVHEFEGKAFAKEIDWWDIE